MLQLNFCLFREDINKQSISIYEEIRADYESYRF